MFSIRFRLVLLLLTTIQIATASPQSLGSKMNLKLSKVPVAQVLDYIEKNSEFTFIYNNKMIDLNREVSIELNNVSVNKVLNELFSGTNTEYEIENKHIALRNRDAMVSSKSIIGFVFDANNETVIGASVSVEGNKDLATLTDIDGKFEIKVEEGATIQISYIGFATQTFKVGKQNEYKIILQEDVNLFDEVVVVGYGVQKKVNMTGSVASISSNDITSIPVSNISNAMAGRMPGVFSGNKSGAPGASSPITIRGKNTPNNTNPTYVIDGVVREKIDFDGLDPNEIESISVLKDAASAAVYGARAANGVILATTKRGIAGQAPRFRYTGLVGTERATRRPQIMSAYNRTQYLNDKFRYNDIPETDSRYYTQDEMDYFKNNNTDWLDMAWKNPVLTQHNLSVNGGSDKINYYMSLGYYNQSGAFDKLDFTRYNVRSNVDAKINKDLSIGLDIDANMRKRNAPYWPHDGDDDYMQDLYRALLNFPRTEPAYINGRPNATIYNWNVLEAIKSGGKKRTDYNTLNTKLSVNYNIPFVEGLKATAMFNYRKYYQTTKRVGKEYTLYIHETSGDHNHIIAPDAKVVGERTRSERGNFVRKDFGEEREYTLNLMLNYDKKIGKHDLGALFVYEQYQRKGDQFWGERRELLTSAMEEMFLGSADAKWRDTNGTASEKGRLAYVGRINYGFDSKYLLEANFRYDASDKWVPGKRWGFFPSVSGAWRISEEAFFKNASKMSFVDNLKLRASYGILGNDGGNDVAGFQYLDKYTVTTGGVFGNATTGILPSVYPNRNITWEKTATIDVGFDLSLYNGLFSLEFDYFRKRTYDILMDRVRAVPESLGASLPKENYAELVNQGLEFLVRHDNKIGEVKYFVSGNFSFARNHYTKIDEAANAYNWELRKGRPMDFITGYYANGIARTDADLTGLPLWNGKDKWEKGDVILQDINGAGGIAGADGVVDGNDKGILSLYSKDPEIIYGLTLGAEWKGIDFNMFFQGVANRAIMFENRGDTWTEQSVLDIWSDAYSPTNPNGAYPRVGGTGSYGANGQASTFWLLNGNYFRAKNLEIGYTFPKKLINKAGLESLRIYVSGTNLFVFDSIDTYDPENSGPRGAYQYPLMKSYNFGLSLSF